MALAVKNRPVVGVNLWYAYRHEFFKGSRQIFYWLVVVAPLIFFLVMALIQILIKLFANPEPGLRVAVDLYNLNDLGGYNTFTAANKTLMGLSIFGLILIVACCLNVANEYRWSTVKMLTTRQPSRVNIVLSKALFALTITGVNALLTIVGWFILAMALKFSFGQPFEINASDWDSIGKGLKIYGVNTLQTYLMALVAMALTFRYKSLIGGIVTYVLYNAVDAAFSNLGAVIANNGYGNFPDWMHPILDVLKFLNPFLLTSSVQRITQREYLPKIGEAPDQLLPNQLIVLSNPVWWAWAMLGIYLVLFTALSIYFFARRDITD